MEEQPPEYVVWLNVFSMARFRDWPVHMRHQRPLIAVNKHGEVSHLIIVTFYKYVISPNEYRKKELLECKRL